MKKLLLPLTCALLLGPAARASIPATPSGTPMAVTVNDIEITEKDYEAKLDAFKAMGMTSVQTYVYWNKVEKTRGVLDWSLYDNEVALCRKHGLKWVPFVVAGPWYLTPEFVRKDPQITMYRCLEHDRDSGIPSIWSPRLKEYIRTYLTKFAEHYRNTGVLESVNIGISGDYGEAIYSVIGNWPGAYHSHAGYWCGDPGAISDFQKSLQGMYPSGIGALNAAWQTHYASFADIKPFIPAHAPSEHAWQDMLTWYRGAMTDYAEFWLKTTRELFPQNDIYLCTGGDMAPEHGSDFSAQSKLAARYGAGIRITNEASSYPMNVRHTRLVGSSGRLYGAYVGHEPAATVTPEGFLGRIFNSVTSGCRQLFMYSGTELLAEENGHYGPGPGGKYLARYHELMKTTNPVVETALYFPASAVADTWRDRDDYTEMSGQIRRFIDYDYVDDRMITDGALRGKSILVVMNTKLMSAATTERIRQWVADGGVAFFLASRALDWDGQSAAVDALLGLTPQSDEIVGIDNLVVRQPKLLPSIAALKSPMVTLAITALQKDCDTLLGMAYTDKGNVAWRRKLGAGQVFAYFGAMDLKPQEQSWMVAQQVPLHFIRDCLKICITEGQLKKEPATLNLEVADVYKVQTDSGLWILNMQEQAKTIEVDGKPLEVPGLSILRH